MANNSFSNGCRSPQVHWGFFHQCFYNRLFPELNLLPWGAARSLQAGLNQESLQTTLNYATALARRITLTCGTTYLSIPLFNHICFHPDPLQSIRCSIYTMLNLYDAQSIRCSIYTMLNLYDAQSIRCSIYTMLNLYDAQSIRCSIYTMLNLYDAQSIRCSIYTMLNLYDAQSIRCSL